MSFLAYLPAFGSGLGHVSRLSVIARELKSEGFGVRFSSSGEGARYLREHGFECDVCPAIDVGWADEKPSMRKTLQSVPSMTMSFIRQVKFELRNMSALRPKIVFSDSRLSAVIAASILGIPCVTMLNQVRIRLPENRWLAMNKIGEEAGAELLGRIWSMSREVLIPDLPPPSTICAKNVWNISSVNQKLKYTGFIVKKRQFNVDTISKLKAKFGVDRSKRTFFAQVSGPSETRKGAIIKILEASKKARENFTFIVSGGDPAGTTEPVKMGNSWYFEWCPIRDELFALADYSIVRGGHTTIAQSISCGKPMIVLPIENHSEQIGNGDRVSELGLGICLKSDYLEPDSLLNAAKEIASNGIYTSRAEEVAKIAEKYNGPENAVKAILSACGN